MFDLHQYAGQYAQGGMKVKRLMHVVEHSSDPDVRKTAARMVTDALKDSMRVDLYQDFVSQHSQLTGEGVDEAWVTDTTRAATQTLTQLEQDLSTAKTQLRQQDARRAVQALGEYYYRRGRLLNSVKFYIKMREFSKTVPENLEMCLLVIEVGIENETWSVVNQHCARGEQGMGPAGGGDKVARGKMLVAQALSLLDGSKYKSAAMKLLDVPAELGDRFNTILSAKDIARYACLFALATFSRAEMKARFIDATAFRAYLELEPKLTQVIRDFYNSQYSCIGMLNELKESLRMDVFLHNHVQGLCDSIWERALQQYTSPYLSVDFNRMAQSMHTTVPEVEKAVAKLIIDGHIAARIDSANKVLYARRGNVRQATYDKTLAAGRHLVLETEDQLRRMSMLQSNFEYRELRGGREEPREQPV
eukprot:TRINITY_DN39901_c0_g1_i1.p2 TRINITY_DN39901_c0_g1~~TRINITY_DN39901_c0_g1_i1.p2  ORF type:complete len:419 (+),score=172.23 TRINITY_DN39901_c0_g1_i1:313-1569(+)